MLVLQPHPLWGEGWSGRLAHRTGEQKISSRAPRSLEGQAWDTQSRAGMEPARELQLRVVRERPHGCLRPSARCPYLFFGDVVGVHRLPIRAHMARPAWGCGKGGGGAGLTEGAHGGIVFLWVTGQQIGVVRLGGGGLQGAEEPEILRARSDTWSPAPSAQATPPP